MKKQKVKVGQEVKNRCPVCGGTHVYLPCELQHQLSTFRRLQGAKRVEIFCDNWIAGEGKYCKTIFWFYPRTGKITVKEIDKSYVDS